MCLPTATPLKCPKPRFFCLALARPCFQFFLSRPSLKSSSTPTQSSNPVLVKVDPPRFPFPSFLVDSTSTSTNTYHGTFIRIVPNLHSFSFPLIFTCLPVPAYRHRHHHRSLYFVSFVLQPTLAYVVLTYFPLHTTTATIISLLYDLILFPFPPIPESDSPTLTSTFTTPFMVSLWFSL
ncbi:hypothetical protein BDN72DRAFT_284118 [Pluteus cervinus]|uniref:Uncharacterized protein n=1 Tax=Pluteus cervinus TaxID=181527 RepID=A0ACD3B4X8_9AGAR|nr:hypothetical protein BDN72DRAFT_284118 [Pluteus cervinus]